ncbi:hypothetical protein V1525DRAFT_397749 [Lipomyces kononenkoae]|uniref:Uncharacterized protein n=1 Tax=Lipomyces kononenkoae TaxID=34357 RepID=A0ACC3T7Y6_LIPKO
MSSEKTIVLITGANSGIGFETAVALAQASADLHVLLGSRSLEKGQKALDEIYSSHASSLLGSLSVLQIDVTDQPSILAARQDVETKYGKLDVLINNAGIIVTRPTDALTNLRETFETNTFGPAIVTDAFLPLLQKSPHPLLIYVSSGLGSVTLRLDQHNEYFRIRGNEYRMSKSALNMLAACHKIDFAEWGCKVCAFDPGYTVTNLTGPEGRARRIQSGARDPKEAANALADIIQGRRDDDIEKSGIVDLDGGVKPW